MNKPLYIVFIFFAVLFGISSCAEKSRRGHWTKRDLEAAKLELDGIRSSIESSVGKHSEVFIDCYLENLENNYSNFEEASNDYDGRAKLAIECTAAVTP